MKEKISVSVLVRYLKTRLDGDPNLQNITVSGELSNFTHHNSGHLYFTLKDEKAAIRCVMFSSKASSLKFEPKNGDKVLINASASIFETTGQLQLYVNSMKLDGLGDLYQQYEELKNRLAEEGLFSNKKKLIGTRYPESVAVLVGDRSAAMSDIKTQFARRWPLCKVDYYPVLVQGAEAPSDIIEKLMEADKKCYDAIILARGGGSFEDLFCFNDEKLVRTIYSLNTFIVTGIGHEQDFTLADFVADLRAPTPTASVELITPNMDEVREYLDDMKDELKYLMKRRLDEADSELNTLLQNRYLLNPYLLIDNTVLKIDYYNSRLERFSKVIESLAAGIDNDLKSICLKLDRLIERKNSIIDNQKDRLIAGMKNYFKDKQKKLEKNEGLLKAYSLDNTLKRGYSIVYGTKGIISSVKDLDINENITIRMHEGRADALIKEKYDG